MDIYESETLHNIVISALFFLLLITILKVRQKISELAGAKDALNNAYDLFKGFIDSSRDLIFVKDIKFKYIFCNQAFVKFIGRSENDIIGHEDTDWFQDRETVEYFRVWDRRVFSEKKSFVIEEWVNYPDNRRVLLETIKSPCFDRNGNLIGLVGVSRDITDRKMSEGLLKKDRTRLGTILEGMRDGIYVVNQQYELQYVNPIIEKDFGSVNSRKCYEYLHNLTEPCPWCKNDQVFAGKKVEWEWHYSKTDKTYELFDTPIINEDGSIFKLEVFHDITERKLIEDFQSFLLRCDHIGADENFFISLARYLAEKLKADYVCIDRLEDKNLSARTVAVWHDGKFEDNVTYTLKDTPCRDVVGKTICSYPERVRDMFPKDEVLQQLGAESYVGTTLWGSEGQPIGLIAMVWRKPITNQHIVETILRLVAVRAAGELEREEAAEALWESIWEYRSLFENMISGFAYHQMIFDENNKPTDYIFLEINSAFEKHTGLTRDIIGKRVTEVLPGIEKHDPDFISIYGDVASSGKSVRFDVYAEPQQKFYTISAYSPKKGFFAAVFDDITERKNAEKELREKSEELTTVLDVLPALVWIAHDPECGVITGNRAVSELFGVSAETNVSQTAAEAGKAFRIRHLTADGTELRAEELPIQRAIALGQPVLNQEFTYDLSDGRQIPTLGSAVPLFDENGNVRGAVGAFWDITERRRAEEALYTRLNLREYADSHTLDELLQYTLDKAEQLTGSQIGFFHFLSADQKILTLQMWSANTLKNMCTAEGKGAHYPVEQAGVWADCVRQQKPVIHNDYASLSERKGIPEGHAPIIRELTLPVIRGSRITAMIGIGNKPSDYTETDVRIIAELADMSWDIISNKLAEDALKKSEERYRKAQTLGKVGNWEYNIRTTHFWGSDEAKRIYGFDPASENLTTNLTTEEVENCIPERERVHQALIDLIEKDAEYNLEFDIIPYNTEERKTIISVAQLERDSNGNPLKITGVIQDITERRQAEAEKVKLESRLRQAQSMEAIGTLAGGIAHDFNNILFPIMGYTEMTMDDLPKNSMGYQNLGEVLKAALRAKELVNQILTFSRQRENEKIILKIQPVVKEALKLIRSTLPTTIALSQNIDPNCNPVMADPTQIHQIIMNLCTNAYHAMQDNGGVLEVILTEVKLGADDLRAYPGSLPGTYLKLSVSDTGIGMAKEMLERIFDPFFTTKPVGKGTGLGLSVVHGIVKQMGGHVRVYSEPGKGTAFHVYMPVIADENISNQKPAVSDESVPTGSERILLTDDEVPILNMLGQMLEELGYRVSPYADSSEAFKAFEKMPDSFDLVITDMTMPNMTGAQLAKKILEIRAGMPIILCTGFSDQINGAKSEKFGIKGYLMKPVIRSEMAKMIRKVLEKVENET